MWKKLKALPVEKLKSILVVRLDGVGDVLLTTPLLRALRKGLPQVRLSVLVGAWGKEIVEGNPNVDEIIVFDAPWLARGWPKASFFECLQTIRQLREKKYDLIIDFRADLAHVVFVFLCKRKFSIGYDLPRTRWLHDFTIRYDTSLHFIDSWLQVATLLGCEVDGRYPELFLPPWCGEKVRELLRASGRDEGKALVALSPGAGYPAKLWEQERWAQLADKLIEDYNVQVVLTGTGEERPLLEKIEANSHHKLLNLGGGLRLKELAALFTACQMVITVDSAASHIAATVGTPVITLFGPTLAENWGPFGFSEGINYIVRKEIDCSPCLIPFCESRECMKMINLEDVLALVERYKSISSLSGQRSSRPGGNH